MLDSEEQENFGTAGSEGELREWKSVVCVACIF